MLKVLDLVLIEKDWPIDALPIKAFKEGLITVNVTQELFYKFGILTGDIISFERIGN